MKTPERIQEIRKSFVWIQRNRPLRDVNKVDLNVLHMNRIVELLDELDVEFTMHSLVKHHSLKPDDALYNSNALCGEIGEVANVIKKIEIRKALKPEEVTSMATMEDYLHQLEDEMGDALFYFFCLAKLFDLDLATLVKKQSDKLFTQSEKYQRTFKK